MRPRSRALSSDELVQLFEKIRETPSFGEDNLLAGKLLLALCAQERTARRSANGCSCCRMRNGEYAR